MIPPQFLQDLLSRSDIIDVVGRHVQLKKAGIHHKGLCPFHNEKTPSFTVSASRQTYHCFGCGVHGNAIGFLMQHCGMSFQDAVSDLAQQAGMMVPQDELSPKERERALALKKQQSSLNELLHKAAQHYQKQIAKFDQASAYLQQRGLSIDIRDRFRLGYAPEGWRFLSTVIPDYENPQWVDCGLVISPEDEGNSQPTRKRYDRFRNRIMFPIRSVQGDVIGFGGRVLDGSEPKYLNSPETPVFSKGRELYGLFEARSEIRRRGYALVVEGYMDVVALAQSGYRNAVATLGTACTAEHISKLFRFTDHIIFSFDGDAAGMRAAARALEISVPFATDARSLRFLFLPSEHDPDSYVREHGCEAFEACIAESQPLSRQLIRVAQQDCDLSSAEGRARFLVCARPLWESLPDGALKRQLHMDLAKTGGLSSSDLAELWRSKPPSPSGPGALRPGIENILLGQPQDIKSLGFSKRPPWSHSSPPSPADHALRILLLHSHWLEQLATDDHDLLAQLPSPHGEIAGWLERHVAEHGAMVWAALEPGFKEAFSTGIIERFMPVSALEDEFQFSDLRRLLDTLWIDKLKLEQTKLAASAGHDPHSLQRYREISLRLNQLKKTAYPLNTTKL